jgi:DNA-binding transcriptional LysR family regulator
VARKCERLLEEYQSLLTEGAELRRPLAGLCGSGTTRPSPAFLPQIFDICLPADSSVTLELTECDNDQARDGLLNGTFDVIPFVAEGARPTVDFNHLLRHRPIACSPPHIL